MAATIDVQMSTEEHIKKLLSPSRIEKTDPFVVLSFCPINVHDTVADIGCGPGFFTIPLAKFLVSGRLYALDLDQEMAAACRRRVAESRMGNVEVMECDAFEFPLEPASLDGAFLAFVAHHSPDPVRFLAAVRSLLQPRGWCTVLEWRRKETGEGPPLERRLDPAQLRDLATRAGFRYRDVRNLNEDQYMVTLRNP